MVLVVGATGLVGGAVCQKLAARGEKVRALTRATSAKEKVEALRSSGIEIVIGDLKDSKSIAAACQDVDAVISTASSTLSRQPGDSIESVDTAGQLALVNGSKEAAVERFIFVSFRKPQGFSYPLSDAKEAVEEAAKNLNFTIVQASSFAEVWLSPALGFDYANGAVRIYGPGTNPINWVSFADVAEMCAVSLRQPAAHNKIIEFGGPEALSPLDVVARFEKIGGKPLKVEHVSEQSLLSQFHEASDPLQKSFAGLMLGYMRGDAMNMTPVVDNFGIRLQTVDEYARRVIELPKER